MSARKAVVNISCNYHQYYTVHTILNTLHCANIKTNLKKKKQKEKKIIKNIYIYAHRCYK